jgi:hypothetical protein
MKPNTSIMKGTPSFIRWSIRALAPNFCWLNMVLIGVPIAITRREEEGNGMKKYGNRGLET